MCANVVFVPVIDSSSLISLARSGLLPLLAKLPFEPVILDVVAHESVAEGLARGHADAAAIESAISGRPRKASDRSSSVDAAVLTAAKEVGTLVANDLTLGRRARNHGVRWLRTADLVLLASRAGIIDVPEARTAIVALRDALRITPELATAYLEELT